jgi:hypothetical protein
VHLALFIEDLRHADLFTQNSCNCHVALTSSCEAICIALPELNPVLSWQPSAFSFFWLLTTDH